MRIALYHALMSGGALRTVSDQAAWLVANNDVDVFTLSSAEQEWGDLNSIASRVTTEHHTPIRLFHRPFGRLNQLVRMVELRRMAACERRLARLIDGGSYDVALVHPNVHSNAPSVLPSLKTPTVFSGQETLRLVHDPVVTRPNERSRVQRMADRIDPLPALYGREIARVDRANVRAADIVVVNSRFTQRAYATTYGVDSDVCYHGVDAERFVPTSGHRGDYVLSVGAFTPRKGYDFLVEALSRVAPESRPRLVICSNHVESRTLTAAQGLARSLNVELEARNMVSDAELVGLYGRARLTVYAPVNEPFGLVPLESMACATPVVAVAEGGVVESVEDGKTGLLVGRSTATFAAAVTRLLEDPDLTDAMGRRGRADVLNRWTWSSRVACLKHALSRAIESRTS